MKQALIDTDILSYYIKGNQDVIKNVVEYLNHFPTLNISSITYYEILGGLEHKQAKRQIADLEVFVAGCNIINIDNESIRISAREFGRLKRNGFTIGNSDLLIAGVAIRHDLVLVTNNLNHFQHIEGLERANWKDR